MRKDLELSRNALKYIAVAAMLIDHIAFAFIPLNSFAGQAMHAFGRLTAPIMSYFIAEGYFHTKNLSKYVSRLAVFAVISHFAFVFFETGSFYSKNVSTSVILPLLCGLLALTALYKIENIPLKILSILFLGFISKFGDWYYIPVIWILCFGIFHENKRLQLISFFIVSLFFRGGRVIYLMFTDPINGTAQMFQFGVLLAVIPLSMYNGEKGKGGKFAKWIFYIFYPLHLIILGLIIYI